MVVGGGKWRFLGLGVHRGLVGLSQAEEDDDGGGKGRFLGLGVHHGLVGVAQEDEDGGGWGWFLLEDDGVGLGADGPSHGSSKLTTSSFLGHPRKGGQ